MEELLRDAQACLQFALSTTSNKFPGALPVSLARADLSTLPLGYVFSLKADGTRVFVVVSGRTVLLVDRTWRIVAHGLCSAPQPGLSIYDAEYVCGVADVIYLFDVICHHDVVVRDLCYSLRHAMLAPWTMTDLISVAVKPIYDIADISRVWHDSGAAEFPVDGIVFTRLLTRYSAFRSDPRSVIKWKPREMITVDFEVCGPDDVMGTMPPDVPWTVRSFMTLPRPNQPFLATRGPQGLLPFCGLSHDIRHKRGSILECGFTDAGGWRVERERPDKDTPNALNTLVNTLRDMREELTIEDVQKQIADM